MATSEEVGYQEWKLYPRLDCVLFMGSIFLYIHLFYFLMGSIFLYIHVFYFLISNSLGFGVYLGWNACYNLA